MSRFINGLVAFVLCSAQCTTGYKWITLKSNDTIPRDAIQLNNITYVGRAIHYNLVLPAEVYNSSFALIVYDKQQIVKRQFEVLTATENCEWEPLSYIKDVPPNVVRAGSAWNKEPIYIGETTYKDIDSETHIASVLIESNRFIYSVEHYWYTLVLTCSENTTWIETSSGDLPQNAVLGGKTVDGGLEYFFGRLLGPSSWIPGMVLPQNNITIAKYENFNMKSLYSQVLVGDTNQYKWESSERGVIPDYAVVGGQAENGELRYIAKIDNEATYALASELRRNTKYDILVSNF